MASTSICCLAPDTEAAAAARASREIGKRVKSDYKIGQKVIQLLLLGTGESGKSTIRKQMQIIHINGFSDKERLEMLPYMKRNIRDSIVCIVAAMQRLSIDFDNAANARLGCWILGRMAENQPHSCLPADRDPFDYSQEFFAAVESLWLDSGVQRSYQNSSSYQLIDCAKYFLDRAHLFREATYTPNDQDILRCRVMTSDISDIDFEIYDGGHSVKFRVYDVGGQRGERRKWIQCFNNVTAILYICDVSSFDQTQREDVDSATPKNRLLESLETFQEVWLNRYLQDVSILLFINKIDQLDEKLRAGRSPLTLMHQCSASLAIDNNATACIGTSVCADINGGGVSEAQPLDNKKKKKKCLGPIDLRKFISNFSFDAFQPSESDKRDFQAAFPKTDAAAAAAAETKSQVKFGDGAGLANQEAAKFACYVQRIFQEIASRRRQTDFKFEYHYHTCYSYFTCAVNTDNVKKVLEGCRRFIIDKHLERFGIL